MSFPASSALPASQCAASQSTTETIIHPCSKVCLCPDSLLGEDPESSSEQPTFLCHRLMYSISTAEYVSLCLQVSSALNDMASRSKYLPPPQRSLLRSSHCNVAHTLHVQETRSELGDNTDFSEPDDEKDAGTIRLHPLLSIHVEAGTRISRTNGSTR